MIFPQRETLSYLPQFLDSTDNICITDILLQFFYFFLLQLGISTITVHTVYN